MRVSAGAPSVQAKVRHETHFKSHNLKSTTTTTKVIWSELEMGLCCDLGQRDEMSNGKTNRERVSERNTQRGCTYVWMLSRCSCDGQIRDSGVEAAPKSRSIIHRDRSSHCRKLWKQNMLNGLSHPIHKRQLTVTHAHTPTHNNDHTDAISFQKAKSRIKKTWHDAAISTYSMIYSILLSATSVIQAYYTRMGIPHWSKHLLNTCTTILFKVNAALTSTSALIQKH